jgi:predicted Fe-Mo cluster-binding NifX family protein
MTAMTLIALSCQNRREITAHAGQCRNFFIYVVQEGRIGPARLLELPAGASLHDTAADQPHALDGVDLLISAGMGDGLRARLARRGVRTLLTTERNPLRAVQRHLAGDLPDEVVPHDHAAHAAGEDGHADGGCGHCGCHQPTHPATA